jgi:hypothetical protein
MKNIYILLCLMVVSHYPFAQTIPNGGFENWNNTQGFPEPDNWTTFNIFSLFSGADYGVTQEAPGAVGSSYVRLTVTEDPTGMPFPAFAFSGTFNALAGTGTLGFPVNGLPSFLSGQYRSYVNGDDFAVIGCFFTRWNAALGVSDTLALSGLEITQSAGNWTNFDIPIIPLLPGTPDSCTIALAAGGGAFPEIGNYLDIDDLHFVGGAASVRESEVAVFQAWPNPMNEVLLLDLTMMDNINAVTLYNMQGRLMEEWQLGATQTTLDVAHLPAGSYILHVTNSRGRWTQPLMKR